MRVLWDFCEPIVLIWNICLILTTSGEFRSKPEKPIDGSKVVFSCDITEDSKDIEWLKKNKTMFKCSAPYSAGVCDISKSDSDYEFNVIESRSGLVSLITIKKFNIMDDGNWKCKHNGNEYPTDEKGKEHMNITFIPEANGGNSYTEGQNITVRCGNDGEQSFYVLERGRRGKRYSNETVTLECFHTGVECLNGEITQYKDINVRCTKLVTSSGVHDVTAVVGDDTELVVDIIMYPVNKSKVHWYTFHGSSQKKLSGFRTHELVNKTKAILTIYEVQAIDSGIYKVDIKKSDIELLTVEFKLKVVDNSEIGFGAGIGVGICLGFLCGSAIIVGGWFIWRWKKSKG